MKGKYFVIFILAIALFSCKSKNQIASTETEENSVNKSFIIHTEYGEMKGILYNETPLHRENFIKLVEQNFYDSLLFHRVIKSFMIQGGDPDSKNAVKGKQLGNGGPGYTVPAEFNPKFIHKKGALSAARMGDQMNPKKESSGSQFYVVQGVVYDSTRLVGMEQKLSSRKISKHINDFVLLPSNAKLKAELDSLQAARDNKGLQALWEKTKLEAESHYKAAGNIGFSELQKTIYSTIGGTPHLDGDYTVFGEITEGLNIIDSIANVKGDKSNRPLEDVIFSIKMIK